MAALGLLIFYIETSSDDNIGVEKMYLLLPFLCLSILYNLIKYSIRIFINNGYLKHLEKQITLIMNDKMFLLNRELKDISAFRSGFAVTTTLAQFPIYIAIGVFLMQQFIDVIRQDKTIDLLCVYLIACLVIEFIFILMMSIDLILVQTKTIMRIDAILEEKDYLQKPEEEGKKVIKVFDLFS